MKTFEIQKKVEQYEGNYNGNGSNTYISVSNMDKFVSELETYEQIEGVLITPYLINKDKAIYELLYYSFEVEVVDSYDSMYNEFLKENSLPEEVLDNLKPKLAVNKDDKTLYFAALKNYLTVMKKMKFELERNSNSKLMKATLYYQIF